MKKNIEKHLILDVKTKTNNDIEDMDKIYSKENRFYFDDFSCKDFDEEVIIKIIKETFDVNSIFGSVILRFESNSPEFLVI